MQRESFAKEKAYDSNKRNLQNSEYLQNDQFKNLKSSDGNQCN